MCEVEASDVIAIIAAIVAVLASLYARWSALAAQKTNEIALHNERLMKGSSPFLTSFLIWFDFQII